MLPGQRKDRFARVLVQHVKADHHDVPYLVDNGALQHPVLGIVGCGLSNAEVAELALGLFS